MEEVIVFDLKGDFAHFKKIFTTTSPLTYGVPTRTAITGVLGAILGYQRDSYYEDFKPGNCRIGLKLLKAVKKTRFNLNLLKTKDETENLIHYDKDYPKKIERIQVPLEALKAPGYRLFISLEDENIREKLKKNLSEHKTVYTPYLGLSEFIAHFEYLGTREAVKNTSPEKEISTVIPEEYIANIKLEKNLRYHRERVPGNMKMTAEEDRKPTEFIDLVYEKEGNPMLLEDITYYEVGDDSVLFF